MDVRAPLPDRWHDLADQDLPRPESDRRLALVRAVAVAAVLSACCYLTWRLVVTVPDASWWLAWPLILLELHSLVAFVLYLHVLWHPGSVPAPAPVTDSGPSVAMLIPTFNESYEVLLPTVAAAAALPQAQQVWVLDDGDRPWVRDMASSLGVIYRARTTHEHAKAGNLNAVLPELTTELVAVLDADHVVRSDFLAHVLGYFADPVLALVQTPQSFYNTDSFEHMRAPDGGQYCEQDLFYRMLAPARNKWGAAFWCGTNSVVRLAVLREIGGVATETVTEDIHTSIRIHRAGYRTVYHNEVLARGLAAANSEQYLNQRLRWGTGAMQVLRVDNPLTDRGLTWHQRLSYASTLFGWFDSWRTLGFILLPMLTVLTGGIPASAPVRTFVALFAASWVVQQAATQMLARGRAPLWPSTVFDFVRMPAALKATTALWTVKPRPFTVTDKGRIGDERRSMPAPRLLVALLAGRVFSAFWYLATLLGLTPATYAIPWVAHGSAIWLAFNAAFLTGAMWRIRSGRFGSERRRAVRFEMTAPAWVDGVSADVGDVSLTGMLLTMAKPVDTGTLVWVDLAPLVPLTVHALVRSSRATGNGFDVGLEFVDMTPDVRAQLALELFQTRLTPTLVAEPVRIAASPPLAAAPDVGIDELFDRAGSAA